MNTGKQSAALAAASLVNYDTLLGVGTGSTANLFIDALAEATDRVSGAVASSDQTARRLEERGFEVLDLNMTGTLDLYIDGADESNPELQLIKGGGGALTREKIVAAASKRFVCIVDESKLVNALGEFPLPIEVIPMARSYVAREIVKLGADPEFREAPRTDNGNIILDCHGFEINDAVDLESKINGIAGVVTCGLFARRPADELIVGLDNGQTRTYTASAAF